MYLYSLSLYVSFYAYIYICVYSEAVAIAILGTSLKSLFGVTLRVKTGFQLGLRGCWKVVVHDFRDVYKMPFIMCGVL